MTAAAQCRVFAPEGAPAGLLDAFWAYDRALLADDHATLNALFMPGPGTVRGDGRNLLVGHDAIAAFRSARARVPTRQVVELYVQPAGDDAALLMARTRDGDATGLQTQFWRRTGDRWLVRAAHVSLPSGPAAAPGPAFDTSVWRAVGDPLVAAAAPGPLDGIGVAVKDLFAVAGQPVGAGNPVWLAEQRPQERSAPAVAALLAAGAHVRGIARTDEFAYSLAGANAHYGTPPNPAAPGSVSGGSTSGPAAAVALGQAAVGLGTDTAGSIRVPASYQGLVGLRTTHGAVSTAGVLPLAPSFDTVGWLTPDVATSAAVADRLLPPADGGAGGFRRTLRSATVEALARQDVQDAFPAAVAQLTGGGFLPPAEDLELPAEVLERWFTAFRTVQAWEAWQAHGTWIDGHPGALGADVGGRFAQASGVSEEEAQTAREVVAQARARLRDWLADGVLVIPSASGPAPARSATGDLIEAERAATLRMTCLAGLAGAPALSLPLLRLADRAPVGVCLVGAPGSDRELLRLAAGFPELTRTEAAA